MATHLLFIGLTVKPHHVRRGAVAQGTSSITDSRLNPLYRLARNGGFVETDQCDSTCPDLLAKIFRFAISANHFYILHRPVPQRGVSRSSRTLERDAMDAAVSLTNDTKADGEVVWS
jgi:hypothetical protein